jgi:hypothetical protein
MEIFHQAAGPLHPSPSMLGLLRLRRALGASFGEATLDLGTIHSIETELAAALPDDVLVLLATRDADLLCATGLSLDTLLDAQELWGEGVPETHVAIARVNSEPFEQRRLGVHYDMGGYEVLAVARPGDRSSPNVLVDGSTEMTLCAFAQGKMAPAFRDNGRWLEALALAARMPLEDESFRPRLVGTLPAAPIRVERLVSHAKFGTGRVIDERMDGGETKLVIEFDGVGRKVLLARFVSDLRPPDE